MLDHLSKTNKTTNEIHFLFSNKNNEDTSPYNCFPKIIKTFFFKPRHLEIFINNDKTNTKKPPLI